MALREHFETSGAWLFRWRSYLPVVLFAVALLGLRDLQYPRGSHALHTTWEVICLVVSLVGLAIRSHAVGYAAMGTSSRIRSKQEADDLNTTGLYSVVRHPLYLGNYLMWLGAALLTMTFWVPVVVSLAFWLYYERIMAAEEAFLRGKYGARFETWANSTPAFLPRMTGWVQPVASFNMIRVLRRESSDILALFLIFVAYDAFADTRERGEFSVDWWWVALFVASVLLYALTSVQKKRARREAAKENPAS